MVHKLQNVYATRCVFIYLTEVVVQNGNIILQKSHISVERFILSYRWNLLVNIRDGPLMISRVAAAHPIT